MKRLKKMIHNCSYLTALLVTWLFLTAGGIGLMFYRDYDAVKWSEFCSNPFFAIIFKEEMHRAAGPVPLVEPVMAEADAPNTPEKQAGAPMPEPGKADQGQEWISEPVISDKKSPPEGQEAPGFNREGIDSEAAVSENSDEPQIGQTVFVTYTPIETNSIYYYDAGKLALTTEYPYTTVGEEYFDDAVFFGDSRTLGISDYAGLNADFYCENGMTIYKLLDEKGVTDQKSGVKVNLNQVLQQKHYGKIYMMLGMNELGYRDTEYFLERYREVVEQLRSWQPDAIIYILANLHVSREKNNLETEFNNININAKNAAVAGLADGKDVFYLDSNPLFTDNEGYLNDDLTFDGVHLYANCYQDWKTFLMEHGVVKRDEG